MIDAVLIVALLAACFLSWMEYERMLLREDVYREAVFFLLTRRHPSKVVEYEGKEYTLIAVPTRQRHRAIAHNIDWDHELQKLKDKGDQHDHE